MDRENGTGMFLTRPLTTLIQVMTMNNQATVESFVTKMNAAVADSKKSTRSIFVAFKDAFENLSAKDFEAFKAAIDMEKSTLLKMTKICKSDAVMENLDSLPLSWGTLYEISRLEAERVKELIANGTLNSRTKRIDVVKILINDKIVTSEALTADNDILSQSQNNLILTLKSNTEYSDEEHMSKIRSAIETLEQYFDVTGNLPTNSTY